MCAVPAGGKRALRKVIESAVSRVPAVEPRWYGIILKFNGEFRV